MEYSLLTLVDDKDLAIKISDYLKSNDVDSYAAQPIEYDTEQWGVYVDESKAETAQSLLDSYTITSSVYSPDYTLGNKNADNRSNAIFPSRRCSLAGFSQSWGYYLLMLFVIGSVRFCIKMDKNNNQQNVNYVNEIIEHNRKTQEMSRKCTEIMKKKMEDGTLFNTPKSQNIITIEDVKKFVEQENRKNSKKNLGSITIKKISMQKTKIFYDILVNDGYLLKDDDESIKKQMAMEMAYSFDNYKSIAGEDILDQFANLGISFNFRFYYKGEKAPSKTISLPASYIKTIDKS
ncbi:MAG: hypothetical protein IKW83_01025 [Muribaculaceae bacterium]|nr:hypothetical protein [Muribaculaceae bacterium]